MKVRYLTAIAGGVLFSLGLGFALVDIFVFHTPLGLLSMVACALGAILAGGGLYAEVLRVASAAAEVLASPINPISTELQTTSINARQAFKGLLLVGWVWVMTAMPLAVIVATCGVATESAAMAYRATSTEWKRMTLISELVLAAFVAAGLSLAAARRVKRMLDEVNLSLGSTAATLAFDHQPTQSALGKLRHRNQLGEVVATRKMPIEASSPAVGGVPRPPHLSNENGSESRGVAGPQGDAQFYVRRGAAKRGPLSAATLAEAIQKGKLRPDDLIAIASRGPWSRLESACDSYGLPPVNN
jgi:hypothetical protein